MDFVRLQCRGWTNMEILNQLFEYYFLTVYVFCVIIVNAFFMSNLAGNERGYATYNTDERFMYLTSHFYVVGWIFTYAVVLPLMN